jgi:hypothetical protein
VNTFQPFKYRRKAESSELYSQLSKEVQATFHGTPLLQCTQIMNGDPNTHIQRGKRTNKTMSFQPKSFTVPNQVPCDYILEKTVRIRLENPYIFLFIKLILSLIRNEKVKNHCEAPVFSLK